MAEEITIKKVHDFLCKLAPPALAESWDNIGLQVGSWQDKLENILVSLDAIEPVLWEAVEKHCSLIVTHHPVLFKPISRLDDSTHGSRIAKLATQIDLNILTFHTNLDSSAGGLNVLLAKKLGLTSVLPLIPPAFESKEAHGMGRLGSIPRTTLKDYVEVVAKRLNLANLRYVGDPMTPLRKVAVVTGSGADYFRQAKAAGADLLITGDVKYHQALDALSEGIALIDVGHFGSEIGMIDLVADHLRRWLKSKKSKIKVFESQSQRDPFQFWQNSVLKTDEAP